MLFYSIRKPTVLRKRLAIILGCIFFNTTLDSATAIPIPQDLAASVAFYACIAAGSDPGDVELLNSAHGSSGAVDFKIRLMEMLRSLGLDLTPKSIPDLLDNRSGEVFIAWNDESRPGFELALVIRHREDSFEVFDARAVKLKKFTTEDLIGLLKALRCENINLVTRSGVEIKGLPQRAQMPESISISPKPQISQPIFKWDPKKNNAKIDLGMVDPWQSQFVFSLSSDDPDFRRDEIVDAKGDCSCFKGILPNAFGSSLDKLVHMRFDLSKYSPGQSIQTSVALTIGRQEKRGVVINVIGKIRAQDVLTCEPRTINFHNISKQATGSVPVSISLFRPSDLTVFPKVRVNWSAPAITVRRDNNFISTWTNPFSVIEKFSIDLDPSKLELGNFNDEIVLFTDSDHVGKIVLPVRAYITD